MVTHHDAKLFANCSQEELLEHAIARLAAMHAERGVIADHLRVQLSHVRQAEQQRRLMQLRPKPFA